MVSVEVREFHWADYLAFGSVLVISTVIGISAAIKQRKATVEHLLTGNRKLPLLMVAMSLAASFLSAISILGNPVEVYFNSAEYWLLCLGMVFSQLFSLLFYMPVIYKLRLTSGYEYLELRFNKTVRILGSLTFTVEMILYMAVVMYTPALALSQVTGLSMELSILGTGLICTFYTALGGMKAVVWTDTFQLIVIFAGYIGLIVRGVYDVGSWDKVMERAKEGGRFTWDLDLNPDPFVRHTFWTLVIGGCFTTMTMYASNQILLQRYLSVRSLNKARWTIVINAIITISFTSFTILIGVVMYAYYYDCDPLKHGAITKRDQMVPLFMMQVLGKFPGLPGLFVACVYSGALSTISSGINSLCAVMLEDFLSPFIIRLSKDKGSERFRTITTKALGVLYGLATIGLAYLTGFVGKTVLIIVISVFGMVGGPLLGLITVGIFFPCINSWGAGAGLLSSLVMCLWTGIGAIVNPPTPPASPLRPLTTDMCNATSGGNHTFPVQNAVLTTPESSTRSPESSGLEHWYSLSYQYYALFAVIVSIVVGFIVSAITGFNKDRKLDRRTFVDVLGCCARHGIKKAKDSKCELEEKMPDVSEEVQSTRL